MYKILITSILVFSVFTLSSQEITKTTLLNDVQNHIGEYVRVCDSIVDTYITKGDKKTTYLNFGASFPNSRLTAVIFENEVLKFESSPAIFMKDKRVCISGRLKEYKGKTEIIVNNTSQIEVE